MVGEKPDALNQYVTQTYRTEWLRIRLYFWSINSVPLNHVVQSI